MSVKLTRIVRLNSRLVTWKIENSTEGTSITMSDHDFKDLLDQASGVLP